MENIASFSLATALIIITTKNEHKKNFVLEHNDKVLRILLLVELGRIKAKYMY